MRGVCFQGVEKVTWTELDDPVIQDRRDAIVRVELAGLCGSDLHPYFGRESGMDPGTVMGHEFVGIVTDAGSEVSSVKIGDRVYAPFSTSCGACFFCTAGLTSRCVESQLFGWRSRGRGLHGGQAEFVRVPNANGTLARVPEGMTSESALLLGDNFSTGYFCAEMAQISPGDVTAVIGCGSVGLLAIRGALMISSGNHPPNTIVAIDPVAERRDRAAAIGALVVEPENAVRQIRALTEGRGADSVMELVGLPAAQKLAFELLRAGGTMSVIGCHTAPHFSFSPVDAYDKNLSYRTGRCPARKYMGELSTKLAGGTIDIDSMITHRFSPEDCGKAYEIFSRQKDGCIKAVLDFTALA